jgi:hypothetical protein
MNYQKIYDNLILSRSNQTVKKDEYYEKHHIIPKCLGGSNDKTNLILLTYREHYLAHLLLCKIHKKHSGIQYAFLCMLRKQPAGQRILTSRMFDTIKRNFSKFKRWHIKIHNPGKTKKSRDLARKRMTENNPLSIDPSKNRTCQPIRIHFTDKTTKDFKYAKQYCIESGMPYATMKHLLRNNVGSKKHNIEKIERLEK